MRPIELTFSGLRSYVEPQTVDFSGKDFIAIIGDTGAGKSTVPDAICYALYNRCSWSGGSVSELVADAGDGTLWASFTFTVSGRTWRVERSTTPRAAAPQHNLVDVDTGKSVTTGANAVTAHIRRIIGLDYDTFLRAVVLPQGRFQELLRMGDADRSRTLKSILGLDQLTKVREHAQTLYSRLAVRLAAYEGQRRALLDDPDATLAEALARQETASAQLDRLQAAQTAIADSRRTEAAAERRATVLDDARNRLQEALPTDAGDTFRTILAADEDISRRHAELDQNQMAAARDEKSIADELQAATTDGTGVAAAATAIATLKVLSEQLPQLDATTKRLDQDHLRVATSAQLLNERCTQLDDVQRDAATKKKTAIDAAQNIDARLRELQQATDRLSAVRTAAQEVHEATDHRAECERHVERLTRAAETLTTHAEDLERTASIRDAEHAQAIQRHAAATAAQGCSAGEPCPVCARELPQNFTAPGDEGTRAPSAAAKAAHKAANGAAARAASAVESAGIARDDTLPAAVRRLAAATTNLASATTHAREALGEFDLDMSDEEVLHDLTASVQDATAAHDTAESAHHEAHDLCTKTAAALPLLEKAHADLVDRYDTDMAKHESALLSLARSARELPRAFRVSTGLEPTEIATQLSHAQQRQTELHAKEADLATVRSTVADLRKAATALDDEYKLTVAQPVNTLHRTLDSLTDRAHQTADHLPSEKHPPRPAGQSLADDAAWCHSLLQYVQNLLDSCGREAAHAHATAQTARDTAAATRLSCESENDEHLELLVRAASTAQHNATRDAAVADAQKPIVADLQRRIDGAAPTVAALHDLKGLLTDGNFIGEAVRKRQYALLAAASRTLLDITGGRFGFGENFLIIDTDTAQPRDVRTLSGGETFQASLALALAVVELASRASGRVDSLFLDEGFGSLDSGVLKDALNALTEHSTAGRLVTVISHMRSIIENADHVLVVERTLTGSRAHWASADERERIINDDLGRGMLP